jgi:hypothetical protein
LGEFHTEYGKYPAGIFAPGILHTFGMIKNLINMAEPPTSLSQFMSHSQQQQRLDVRLGTALTTTLDDIHPYLLKGKGLLTPRFPIPEFSVDSRNDIKELTNVDGPDNVKELAYPVDGSDDVKERSKGLLGSPIDLSTDSDEEKENDADHPGHGWMRYDSHNNEHYPVYVDDGDTLSTATYIRYIFDREDTILEGTDGKLYPIYRKALHSRSYPGKPNTQNDKLIHDDHLFVMDPESDLRGLVDRAIHAQKDPGLTADVVRFRAQKNRENTLAARLKSLEEDIRLNHDTLSLTRRHLIHARAATRIFNSVYETPAPEAPTHRAYFIPKLRGAQGPADTLRCAHTPPDDRQDWKFSPYRRPMLATPEFCYECFQTSPDHHPRDCPDYGHCYFCTSNQHESLTCISPHLRCKEFECIVPSWHNHHGLVCSAKPAARILRLMRFWPTEALQQWDAEPDVPSSPSEGEISEGA